MSRRGFVVRQDCAADRRGADVVLTAAASAPSVMRQNKRGNVRADLITLGFIVDHPRRTPIATRPAERSLDRP